MKREYRMCVKCGKRAYMDESWIRAKDGEKIGHYQCLVSLRVSRNKHLNGERKPTCRVCDATMRKIKRSPGWIQCKKHGMTARWPKPSLVD